MRLVGHSCMGVSLCVYLMKVTSFLVEIFLNGGLVRDGQDI